MNVGSAQKDEKQTNKRIRAEIKTLVVTSGFDRFQPVSNDVLGSDCGP